MAASSATVQPKTQRLFDLVAALLRHSRSGITLSQLRNEVPGYWGEDKKADSVAMMFERDKAELRALGVDIAVVPDEKENPIRYRLDRGSFFLPELTQAEGTGGGSTGVSAKQVGFSSGELAAMVHGANMLAQLGFTGLAERARGGLRRLSHDLPLDDLLERPDLVRGEDGIDQGVLEQLSDAVQRRKRVTFRYHGLEQPSATERQVLPYGLACIEGRWSLFAHDEGAKDIRQFRLRRLRDLQVNPKNKATPDFEVPADFDLWERTKHRFEWELGSGAPERITVRFLAETGLTTAARQQGESLPDDPEARVFAVRRREPFLRWVLAFAGEATIVAPQDAAAEFTQLVRSVSEHHAMEAAR